MSTTARPIKVTEEVPDDLESIRADQIAKIRENSGKVTAVVVVMTVFSKKHKSSTTLGSRKTKLGLYLKELVLKQTKLRLEKAKLRPNCTSKYAARVSLWIPPNTCRRVKSQPSP